MMTALFEFLKRTVIGGVVFLLPIGIIVFAISELWSIASKASNEIQQMLFPEAESALIPVLLALAALLLAAFAGGLAATTAPGHAVYARLERVAKASIPGYMVIRQSVADICGGAERLNNASDLRIVLVDLGAMSRFGFVMDRLRTGDLVVFPPGAPSGLSGIVVCVGADKVTETDLKSPQLMDAMGQLGNGLGGATLPGHVPAVTDSRGESA